MDSSFGRALSLIRQGRATYFLNAARRRLYSDDLVIGLRRDLTVPLETPKAKIPVTIRPLLGAADHAALKAAIATSSAGANAHEAMELSDRLRMLEAGIETCYAAVDEHDNLCYVQWLVKSDANAFLHEYYHGAVPELESDETLLEGAYSFAEFRGLGIMACAMAQIAERASDSGGRWVITFVGEDNVPSLKGCKRAGFDPFIMRRRSWRLFRRKYIFEPLRVQESEAQAVRS
jgi:GNAT superfamily N-acetyltransferase